jgi:hypothetical protein
VSVPVIDVDQVAVQCPCHAVPVNRPTVTRVVAQSAGEAELLVQVTCRSTLNLFNKIYFVIFNNFITYTTLSI